LVALAQQAGNKPMLANEGEFTGKRATETLLEARGFDARTGARSGGIKDPEIVVVPAGAILFRLYHVPIDKARFAGWWFTPFEMQTVIDYFARDGAAFAAGRTQGKGILHATLAVRHDWSGYPPSPDHLGRFVVIRLKRALKAYFGVADVAPSQDQRENQKPIEIIDSSGQRRRVRQLYFPGMLAYRADYDDLLSGLGANSDSDLIAAVKSYGTARLPFES
jgi:hypothetical protein